MTDAGDDRPMKMFGTNGVRGIANEYLCCELALQMGKSIGKILGTRIAVAMDTRVSSQMVKFALCSGLMSVGSDILDLGMVPTPALQHYIRSHPEVTGGVMITASHNPPEFNGIKCISGDGTECTHEEETAIENLYDTEIPVITWEHIGSTSTVTRAAEDYVESIVALVDAEKIRKARLTVCVDCANGASVETTPMLLRRLGVRAITINGNPQGEFPGHPSEPTEDNLLELKKLTASVGADLGVAHDGDADRCVFVTGSGNYVSGDLTLALLARSALRKNPNGEVVITVATSKVVEDTVRSAGGSTVYTAVGSPIVARKMAEDGGIFGGEENGGLIFADHQLCRDGAMGLAKMLEIIAAGESLDSLVNSLPKYTTIKNAVKCPDILKTKILDAIAESHREESPDRTDGLRINYDDGWVLLRPSGTEPKFRIYSESIDPSKARERSESLMSEFQYILEKLA